MKTILFNRRKFLKTSTLGIVGGCLAGGLATAWALRPAELLLRPPGALEEDLFLASCIKCGQCLQVCPPQVIELAGIDQGIGIGTPYITPRAGACILCKGLPCVLSCPTGALDHQINHGTEANMGLAVFTGKETCLARDGENDLIARLKQLAQKADDLKKRAKIQLLQDLLERLSSSEKKRFKQNFNLQDESFGQISHVTGTWKTTEWERLVAFAETLESLQESCRVCLDTCPIKEVNPIVFYQVADSTSENPGFEPIVQSSCVGCGVCEMNCPTATASIQVMPRLKGKHN